MLKCEKKIEKNLEITNILKKLDEGHSIYNLFKNQENIKFKKYSKDFTISNSSYSSCSSSEKSN